MANCETFLMHMSGIGGKKHGCYYPLNSSFSVANNPADCMRVPARREPSGCFSPPVQSKRKAGAAREALKLLPDLREKTSFAGPCDGTVPDSASSILLDGPA